jgi:signal peptide peptidase SppA
VHTAQTTWLMDPAALEQIQREMRHLPRPTAEQLEVVTARLAARSMKKVAGKVAVLQVHGIIERRLSDAGYYYGSFCTERGGEELMALLARPDVGAVVLDIDSPGGTDCEEFAELVYRGRDAKTIVAVANSYAASAAYWIGSAASQFAVTPGGLVGSVGAYILHMDWSKALDDAGVKPTFVKAGRFKAETNPYEPLNDDARDHLQEIVDDSYTRFIKAVARNRGATPGEVRGKEYGEGRILTAERAIDAGMVDRIATLREVVAKLGGTPDGLATPQPAASVEQLRLRQAIRRARSEGGLARPVGSA